MSNNGISKKVCVVMVTITTISSMAGDKEKWPFAMIIAAVGVAYIIKQTILDWRNYGKEKE